MIENLYVKLKNYSFMIVLFLLVILFFDVFIVMSKHDEIIKRKNQIIGVRSMISSSKIRLNNFLKLKKEMKKNSLLPVKLISKFGNTGEETDFIHKINEFLKEENILFKKMKIERKNRDKFNSYICSAKFDYKANFDKLLNFLKKVRKSKYFLTVESCKVKFLGNDDVKGDMVISFYINGELKEL